MMETTSIYQDMAQRTGGSVYIGVVGPVRTGPAVDVGTLSQLADGDGFGGLLRHEIHQCLPQLPLCLSDAPVNTSLFHTNTLRTLFDLPNS